MEAEDVRSSFLATTVHLQEDLELSSRHHDAAQAVSDGLRDAKATNTRRAYQTAWHLFCEWTLLTGRQSMPAEHQTVALYLGHLAADGKAIATIAQARAAISHAHAAQGISKGDNPARHPGRGRDPERLAQSGSSAQTGRRTHPRCPGPHPGDCPPSETRPR